MGGRRKAKRPKLPPAESQEWACEHGPLPTDDPPLTEAQTPNVPSSQLSLAVPTPGSQQQSTSSAAITRQSQNGHHSHWLPWQDCLLASEAIKLCPFLKPAGKLRQAAWDELAEILCKDSAQMGGKSRIDRTGDACRARFKKLIDFHKKEETRSLQKTGTNEEVDEHIETMTELVQLWDARDADKENRSSREKAKVELEEQGACELRDAAMMGRVCRQTLVDVTQIEDATVREKCSQHDKKKHPCPSSPDPSKGLRPLAKHQWKGFAVMEDVIQAHQETTLQRLKQAQETDTRHHEELMDGFSHLSRDVAGLTEVMCTYLEHEDARHAADMEIRAKENEHLNDLLRYLLVNKSSTM